MWEDNPKFNSSWLSRLQKEFDASYFKDLKRFLDEEKKKHLIFPETQLIFEAFNQTPFNKVKVVIIGQDPYHNNGQAHGLSFSVQNDIKLPPSLRNIYKELHNDLKITPSTNGNLIQWAQQGVLLLNATLTVRAHDAGSHQKKGWEQFTDAAIQAISNECENIVFILWGSYAQKKGDIIDETKHHIITSPHPSPFSAHRGFFGSNPFSKTNLFLQSKGIKPVNWSLTS